MRENRHPLVILLLAVAWLATAPGADAQVCNNIVKADVVALDQVFFWNRLGACQPQGQIFALKRDVVNRLTQASCADPGVVCTAGNVELRKGKRPRPMVLRMNAGDCLEITFTNLLNRDRDAVQQCPECIDQRTGDPAKPDEQPATRTASVHVIGLQLVDSIDSDGSNVGENASSLVSPGETTRYTLYAEREGQHLLYSAAATTGGQGDGGTLSTGLFGSVNVEPAGSTWLRSQVTEEDMRAATVGTTPTGQPQLDYKQFRMLDDDNNIVHSDLTAVIAGPFAETYPENVFTYPDRDRSFREFTIIYHDELGAVQAFPQFEDPLLKHALHSVRDAFAINYGTGGIGAEILANRLGVGAPANCTGCKYEEFFLTSWVLGDPAMVVDNPANSGMPATEAFYPDDPSNVYHSYLKDHLKFRILHAGPKEHHIHHLHAHQWLYAPDSDESAYLDSQAIGPGAGYTLEIAYEGSGNRNQTVGDSIFHCHFYPHFAMGMWAMWRVHDVFEDGSRPLPDPEILAGTPSPAVVPIPGNGMAPMPSALVSIAGGQVLLDGVPALQYNGDGNPGYPYWIPGVAGSRPPHPPLDTVHDGGLRRHLLMPGGDTFAVQTRFDFTKEIHAAEAIELPEAGLPVEKVAMAYHGGSDFDGDGSPRTFKSSTVSLGGGVSDAQFIVNGLPPAPGAPFAEPCIDDFGQPTGEPRLYKAANIQLDVVFNKAGWHFPQQRLITLWGDVEDTFAGLRPPEPFFFRANSGDCITYYHTNLVPGVYEMDDFQVRTPTDILGQHIHLVKFDVTSSDGSANGWNYEDGTFSPDEVRERIHAIRAHNHCLPVDPRDGTFECPVAEAHPFFDNLGPEFLGAQTTVQRWYADPVRNNAGDDRTLRTVFTHDHYGPSTHQQAGLYAGLVVEPRGSEWRDQETGQVFGDRFDGGPTSWRADIITGNAGADSYREFLFEFQDFALAYESGSQPGIPEGRGPVFPNKWACAGLPAGVDCAGQQPGEGAGYPNPGKGFDNRPLSVNPPAKDEVWPELLEKAGVCGGHDGAPPPPCPEAITADDVGTFTVNYRNDPVAQRIFNPQSGGQTVGNQGDLALAFASIKRADPRLNAQPTIYPPLTPDIGPYDPFTPIIQAFESDRVQIRTLVGAHEEGHNFAVNGIKWLFEPSWTDSGYRNSQMMGISEHFELIVPQMPKSTQMGSLDYLYTAGAATDDLWNGIWGLFRVHKGHRLDLQNLPNNPNGGRTLAPGQASLFDRSCPWSAPKKTYKVVAATAQQLLGGSLEYNSRQGPGFPRGPIHDPNAILYVREDDVGANGKLKPGVPVEPLVLRANAGDCIEVTLTNKLPDALPVGEGYSTLPMIVEKFNNNQIRPSSLVGLHPQLVAYDASRYDGNNVGKNAIQTARPGRSVDYQWYAGDLTIGDNGVVQVTPIEFGATNLIPADRVKQPSKGAIAALVIEPEGSEWVEDSELAFCDDPGQVRCSRAAATVYPPGGAKFREFVTLFQDDVNMSCNGCGPAATPDLVPNLAQAEDPEDSGQKAFNYRTEPLWFRMGFAPDTPLSPKEGGPGGCMNATRDCDFTKVLSNEVVGGDPETPVFQAAAGTDVRFRVLEPGGHARNHVFQLHGHVWQIEPYTDDSTRIGENKNSLGQWLTMFEGSKMGHGPTNHFDAVLQNGAGGAFRIPGDYLFRDQSSFQFDGGLWGIFRVLP